MGFSIGLFRLLIYKEFLMKKIRATLALSTALMSLGLAPYLFGSESAPASETHPAAKPDGTDHLSALPPEVRKNILSQLSDRDLASVAKVNKSLNAQTHDDDRWRKKVMEAVGPITKDDQDTWKQISMRVDALNVLKNSLMPFQSFLVNKGNIQNYPFIPYFWRLVVTSKTGEDVYSYIYPLKIDPPKRPLSEVISLYYSTIGSISLSVFYRIFDQLGLQRPGTVDDYWLVLDYAYEHKIPITYVGDYGGWTPSKEVHLELMQDRAKDLNIPLEPLREPAYRTSIGRAIFHIKMTHAIKTFIKSFEDTGFSEERAKKKHQNLVDEGAKGYQKRQDMSFGRIPYEE